MIPQVRAVRPVRPPASTPDADSTNVVTVDVPVQAPTMVPMESDSMACFICGILPCSSSMPARAAVPTSVPMVSNMSIMQNVMMSVMAVNQPISRKPAKLNLNNVKSTMSPNAGSQEASDSPANGSIPKKSASPAQYNTEATSIPTITALRMPRCAIHTMTNKPINIVATVSTIIG